MKALKREADIYSHLNQSNIVKRMEVLHLKDPVSGFEPIHVLIFMELMEGDLKRLIYGTNRGRMTERETLLWLRQVVSALWYLHNKNISHLDLKPNNILYSTRRERGVTYCTYKLTDFGISQRFDENQPNVITGEVGTKFYAPPEFAVGETSRTKPANIYSLGICIAESIGGRTHSTQYVIKNAQNWNQLIETRLGLSRELAQIISMATDPDSDSRPTIDDISTNL